MAEQLPNGWARTKLAEVCLPVEKVNPGDFPDTEFTYFDIGGIDNKHNRIAATKNILGRSAPSRARQLVRKNDILFSTVRTYLRNIARIETDYSNSLASTGFAVIRPVTGVSSDFLFFQFLTEKFLKPLNDLQSGTSYPAVRAQDVFSQAVVIAPEIEQQRIVTKLTHALYSIAKANDAAHRARERLQRYRFALIESAVSGNLTAEWRESRQKEGAQLENGSAVLEQLLATRGEGSRKRNSDMHPRADGRSNRKARKAAYPKRADADILDFPSLPGGWEWGTLEMVAEIGSGISVSENRGVRNPIHVPYLRVANVLRGYLDLSEVKNIRVAKDRAEEYRLKPGDVLFTEGGDRDKLGRGWVWEGELPECIHQNHVFRARILVPEKLNPKFVSHWGNTFGQRFFLKHATQTTNLASINRTVLSRLPIPIPPVSEQVEIIATLENRLGAVDRLNEKIERQLALSHKAGQLLLDEAFSGKLVPQDNAEEPASALLRKVNLARELEIKRVRANRMPRSTNRTVVSARPDLLQVLKETGKPITPEELFKRSGHSQDSVDLFFAELKELTKPPAQIEEKRGTHGSILLKAAQ